MKILLVDDHILFREGFALLLARLDKAVQTIMAGSCDEALDALNTDNTVDLVLMDLCLPGMSGFDGMSMLRERYPAILLVALSSNCDRSTVLLALDHGAMGFIPKSSSVEEMIAALQLILAKGIYLPPSAFLDERYSRRETFMLTASPMAEALSKRVTRPTDIGLTRRQAEVLYLILQGKPAKAISLELGLSDNTVKTHTSAVLRVLNVTTRTQAVIAAGRLNLKFV